MSIDSFCKVVCKKCSGEEFIPVYRCGAYKNQKGDSMMSHREPVDGTEKYLSYGFLLTCRLCGETDKTFGDEIRKEKLILGIFHKAA